MTAHAHLNHTYDAMKLMATSRYNYVKFLLNLSAIQFINGKKFTFIN